MTAVLMFCMMHSARGIVVAQQERLLFECSVFSWSHSQKKKGERKQMLNAQDFIRAWRYAVAVEEGGSKLASHADWHSFSHRVNWSPFTSGKTDSLSQVKGSSWSPCILLQQMYWGISCEGNFCLSCAEPGLWSWNYQQLMVIGGAFS